MFLWKIAHTGIWSSDLQALSIATQIYQVEEKKNGIKERIGAACINLLILRLQLSCDLLEASPFSFRHHNECVNSADTTK